MYNFNSLVLNTISGSKLPRQIQYSLVLTMQTNEKGSYMHLSTVEPSYCVLDITPMGSKPHSKGTSLRSSFLPIFL